MQQHWLIVILLAVTFSWIAHGRTFESNKDLMTSLMLKKDAVKQMDEKNLGLDNVVTIRTPSSAVLDWSLVCQQLCGAALGGAVCAPFCKNLPFLPFEVQLKNAKDIMKSKQDLLCPKLCGLQLGDDVCTCKNYITNELDVSMNDELQTNVCAIICDHNSVTLTGCTTCKTEEENNDKVILRNLRSLQKLFQKQAVPFAASTATTPNWKELCASWCKTGDGGALCNCNLSPFSLTF